MAPNLFILGLVAEDPTVIYPASVFTLRLAYFQKPYSPFSTLTFLNVLSPVIPLGLFIIIVSDVSQMLFQVLSPVCRTQTPTPYNIKGYNPKVIPQVLGASVLIRLLSPPFFPPPFFFSVGNGSPVYAVQKFFLAFPSQTQHMLFFFLFF